MQLVYRTHRPWFDRLVDTVADRWRRRLRRTSLCDLDARMLADIGIDRSEISAIAAEARSRADTTRLRIIACGFHG